LVSFSDRHYLRTKDDAEIDIIIECPGMPHALIEIKSTLSVSERDVATLNRFASSFTSAELFCLSRDPHEKRIGATWCLQICRRKSRAKSSG
jgi:hypothetical protein